MITLGILGGIAVTIGIVQSVRLVANDGHHRIPTRTHTNALNLR
jgi:hypothetical protein